MELFVLLFLVVIHVLFLGFCQGLGLAVLGRMQ
jgi:hypothetical protein